MNLLMKACRWTACILILPGLLMAQDVNTESAGARAEFLKGMQAFDRNDQNGARAHWDKAIEIDPEFAGAYLYRSWVATSAEDWKAHFDQAKAHRESASRWTQILIDQQTVAIAGDSKRSMAFAHQLVTEYPTSARAYSYLSSQYSNQRMFEAARGVMKTAMALDPGYVAVYSGLANSYIFEDPIDLKAAEKYAKKYVAHAADAADSYVVLGDVYRAGNDFEKASAAYANAIEVDPSDATTYAKKGHADTFSGDFEAARAAYAQAAGASKTLGEKTAQHSFTAYSYLYAGDVEAAMDANASLIEELNGATEGDRNFPLRVAYGDRALIAMHHGMLDEAESALEERVKYTKAVSDQVGEIEWSNTLMADDVLIAGMLAVRRGELKDARELGDKYKQLRANQTNERRYDDLHRLLGLIELADGNADEAIRHLEQANVQDPLVKYELAEAHEAAGNSEGAMKLYEEVAEFNFNGVSTAICRPMAEAKLAM